MTLFKREEREGTKLFPLFHIRFPIFQTSRGK